MALAWWGMEGEGCIVTALREAKLRAKPWEVPTVMSEDLFW
jgi:hypothetical protein